MAAEVWSERHDGVPPDDRMGQARLHGISRQVQRLLQIGQAGLPLAYDPDAVEFAQTVRRAGRSGADVRREGSSLRYGAIAALGLSRLDVADQRTALSGRTAAQLSRRVGVRALGQADPGAIALAAWAQAETCGTVDDVLFARLIALLSSDQPIPTVDLAWMLTAAVAMGDRGEAIATPLGNKLLDAQGAQGIYPHVLPASSQNRWRRHVGSFADQVYPLQALARRFRVTGEVALLEAAEQTARTLCELQGPDGQWWWHYDARTGEVVERFPVYAVHQHAMAPMVLFDLADAGGTDRTAEIVRGLRWLDVHPEVTEDLVCESSAVIWRKAGRREPPKAARKVSAVTTALRPGLHFPGIDRAWPASRVDHECRPYELGWLLYAWLPAREVAHHD